MSKGFDVSHYQGNVDYKKVNADGYEFVIAKATEGSKAGSDIVDPYFQRNISEANKVGIQTNAYHYFIGISVNDAKSEADLFIENLKKVKLTGYVFIDVEDKSLTKDKEALTCYVNAFLDHLEANGYTKLGIYSGRSFYETRLVPSKLKSGILKWIAAYNNRGAGVKCDIWQHSSDGRVNGVNGRCDVNISFTNLIGKPKPAKEVVKVPIVKQTFKDVPQSRDSFVAIEEAFSLGLIHGYPDGTYKPTGTLTREQAAEIALNIYNSLKK